MENVKETSIFNYFDVIYEFRLQRKKTLNFKLNFAYLTEHNIAFVNVLNIIINPRNLTKKNPLVSTPWLQTRN